MSIKGYKSIIFWIVNCFTQFLTILTRSLLILFCDVADQFLLGIKKIFNPDSLFCAWASLNYPQFMGLFLKSLKQ